MVGAILQNKGTLAADSAVREGGRVFLRATKRIEVDAAGRIVAGGTTGGEVSLRSDDTTLVSGRLEATGSQGQGGRIDVLGDKVGLLDGARLDASGETGGGNVRVGGDFQGKNAAVPNASVTYVEGNAQIQADALESGDGGKIIVWADDTTRFYGTNSARGGEQSGNGGFVEVSGKRYLDYQGLTDTRAANGNVGTLLLDPSNVTIVTTGGTGGSFSYGAPEVFTSGYGASTVGWDQIQSQLFANDVVITTTGFQAGALGDITIAYGYNYSSNNNLSLLANHDIIVAPADAEIVNSGLGSISLFAGWDSGSTSTPNVVTGTGHPLQLGQRQLPHLWRQHHA
jgi:hypothetical protein